MEVKAIGYNDPRYFYKHPKYKEHCANAIHLCATKSLERAVKKLTSFTNIGVQENNVLNSLDFIKSILGNWSRPDKKLEQYAKLSEIIREFKEKLPKHDQDLLKAFRLNQGEVLQTMRVLTEINLLPKDLQDRPIEREEEIFSWLWEEMIQLDTSFQNIQGTINEDWKNTKLFRKKVQSAFIKNNVESHFSNKIVLHGFYFITPIQHKIFSLLKEANYELIFLNLNNSKFPAVFKSVRSFISMDNGWTNNWELDSSDEAGYYLGKRFASSFEEDNSIYKGIPNIEKIVYDDFYNFLTDYEDLETTKKTIYLSPEQDNFNNRIKEYYPEIFKEDRHLLAYPAPQFLFHLHRMWDEQKNNIILTEETLIECFSSGWLIDPKTKKNASSYTRTLIDLLPFFQTCKTADEWLAQLDKLTEVYMYIINPLKPQQPTNQSTQRFHKMLENPYKWISYLNLSEKDLKQVNDFIKELLKISESLFGKEEKISLKEHFTRLESIVESGLESTVQQEKNIAEKLIQKLRLIDSEEKFLMQDLSEAISLYLNGSLDDEDNYESIGYKKIFSFDDIDGKVIEAMLNNKSIHICGLDEDSLPNSSSTLPWPLTKRTLESLKTNMAINMYLLREELKPSISRYLFYSFASFTSNGKVSWLKKWDNKDKIEESFYLSLLDIPTTSTNINKHDNSLSFPKSNLASVSIDINLMLEEFPEFILKEYFYCPRRFFYSFITQDRSTYKSNFHLEFLFGNVVKTFPKILNKNNEEIKVILEKIFPQLGKLKFEYLRSNNLPHVFKYSKTEFYDGQNYLLLNKQMQLLLHIGSKNMVNTSEDKDLKERWNSIFDFEYSGVREQVAKDISLDKDPLLTPKPSNLCRFCPHIDHCPSGYYPADDEHRRLNGISVL